MDRDFGHWLAGFIDGEGCFTIVKNRGSWQCNFAISVRSDDGAILIQARDWLQAGHIFQAPRNQGRNPMVEWRIGSLDDCLALIQLLDECPLRAKKAADYRIWREAIFAKQESDNRKIGSLAQVLKAGRAYKLASSPW